MVRLTINGKSVEVVEGATVREAALALGIHIPTLCFLKGYPHHTSCMVCLVKNLKTGKLLPSCSALAEEGMEVDAESEEVRLARKAALDLLLGEHVGDCEGPCRRGCPAFMNIPEMIRLIQAGHWAKALSVVREEIPFPAILGRICPAPCEKVCRRTGADEAVSICLLKRYVGDWALRQSKLDLPERVAATGKKVAVVGAGPAGLSAAFYLQKSGHACTVFDQQEEPGGALLQGVAEETLPRAVVRSEVDIVRQMGAELKMRVKLGRDVTVAGLRETYDAVIVCIGTSGVADGKELGLAMEEGGLVVDPHTYQTSSQGVFAAGGVIGHGRMAIRAVADGHRAAVAADQFLCGKKMMGVGRRFQSVIGKLQDEEMALFLNEGSAQGRVAAGRDGLDEGQAKMESGRCMHCDCRKAEACRLRDLADEYGGEAARYRGRNRKKVEQVRAVAGVIYEAGKCIDCGICVRITSRAKERLGLAFVGRGFAVRVAVPLSGTLEEGLRETAEVCVKECPTGALAMREEE